MKIILPAVMSADGRVTKGHIGQAHYWSSPEDKAFFAELLARHTALVMGRKTYQAVQPVPTHDKLRLVLTSHPEQFAAEVISDSLEFMQADSPQSVIEELEKRGYREALLVGGASVHAAFLRAGVVDELYLTIEPVLFGAGVLLVDGAIDVSLTLLEARQLSKQGTLLLHYAVHKS